MTELSAMMLETALRTAFLTVMVRVKAKSTKFNVFGITSGTIEVQT